MTRFHLELNDQAAKIVRKLDTMPQWMATAVAREMNRQNILTVSHIQRDYLSFPSTGRSQPSGLRFQSGRYRNSLRASEAEINGTNVLSSIGSNVLSAGGVSYPAVQEFGATIPAHKIEAKNGKALRFIFKGRVVFAKSVKIPEVVLPARAPISRGISDRLPAYVEGLSKAIVSSWRANN